MYHYSNTGLLAFYKGLQDSLIICMEELTLIGHKQLHSRVASLSQFWYFLHYLWPCISHNRMKGIIHHSDALGISPFIFLQGL